MILANKDTGYKKKKILTGFLTESDVKFTYAIIDIHHPQVEYVDK